MPFGIMLCIRCTHHGLTFVLLCVLFPFADGARCGFAVTHHDWLAITFIIEIIHIFHSEWIDCRYCTCFSGLSIAENRAKCSLHLSLLVAEMHIQT